MAADKARMPFFQFYPTDFLASGKVSLMDPAEIGAHILLLCQAWLSDPPASIPDDDRVLAKWARMTIETWAGCKPSVLAAWELRDGRWFQPRMESEWIKAERRSTSLSEAGRRGGLKSAQARPKPGLSEAQAFSESESESESEAEAATMRVHVKAIKPECTNPHEQAVFDALDAWSLATEQVSIDIVRGGYARVKHAMRHWATLRPSKGGNAVAWHVAALECIVAARSSGKPFKAENYALTIVGGMMGEYAKGIAPGAGGLNGKPGHKPGPPRPERGVFT